MGSERTPEFPPPSRGVRIHIYRAASSSPTPPQKWLMSSDGDCSYDRIKNDIYLIRDVYVRAGMGDAGRYSGVKVKSKDSYRVQYVYTVY